MNVHYLEIVTPKVDALCDQYSKIHGVTFSEPENNKSMCMKPLLGHPVLQ